MSGESRVDLLNWVNDLLQLNYTKVEQLGTGAAYCQILDSIFLDVPMARVKFDTTKEYEYLNNFKVLQSSFVKHKISKTIPVDRLIKCKFQDNLEFFQWIRKFWKENKDESDYDPHSRRKYLPPTSTTPTTTSRTPSLSQSTAHNSRTVSNQSSSARRITSSSSNNGGALGKTSRVTSSTINSKPSSRVSSVSNSNTRELEHELTITKNTLNEVGVELEEYKNAVEALETERNFYFNKLREIEILTETTNDLLKTETESEEVPTLKDLIIKVQEILYNTEEGFQVPDEFENNEINMEEETF